MHLWTPFSCTCSRIALHVRLVIPSNRVCVRQSRTDLWHVHDSCHLISVVRDGLLLDHTVMTNECTASMCPLAAVQDREGSKDGHLQWEGAMAHLVDYLKARVEQARDNHIDDQ